LLQDGQDKDAKLFQLLNGISNHAAVNAAIIHQD
jgi:hypothetical protein